MQHKRLILGILLTLILLSIMIYGSVERNTNDPTIYYILTHYEQYNNTQVIFAGEITELNKDNQTITMRLRYPSTVVIEAPVDSIEGDPEEGDLVEILGTLNGRHQVTAEKVLVSNRWQYDLVYLRSIPAVPFAMYLFFRTWRFNLKTIRFQRRDKKDA